MISSRRYGLLLSGVVASAIAAGLALAVLAFAATSTPELRWGPVAINFGLRPKILPRGPMAPVELVATGRVQPTANDVPALREFVIDFDKQGSLDLSGLPGCSELRLRHAGSADRAVCGDSLVGSGLAHVETPFPDGEIVQVPLSIFKGSQTRRGATLFVRGFMGARSSMSYVAAIQVGPLKAGPYGTRAVIKVPRILDGALLDFSVRFKNMVHGSTVSHGVIVARCASGRLTAEAQPFVFSNGEEYKGQHIIRSCTPSS